MDNKDLYFIDIEASGFGKGSYPIEIGYISDNTKFCSLIKPLKNWSHWDKNAESIHGISQSILQEYGKDAAQICDTLNENLYGKKLYSDAWGNDSSWLWTLFNDCQRMPAFQLESIRQIIPEQSLAKWQIEKDKIIESQNIQRHRASNDAFVLQQTYYSL